MPQMTVCYPQPRQLAGLSRTCKTGFSKGREDEWNRFIGGQGSGLICVSEKFASVEDCGWEAVGRVSLAKSRFVG